MLQDALIVASHAIGTLVQGITGIAEAKFQLMAAFGIPADTQDMSPLYAWLRRNADLPFGLIMHNVDGMLKDAMLRQQFSDILANIIGVCSRMCFSCRPSDAKPEVWIVM